MAFFDDLDDDGRCGGCGQWLDEDGECPVFWCDGEDDDEDWFDEDDDEGGEG